MLDRVADLLDPYAEIHTFPKLHLIPELDLW